MTLAKIVRIDAVEDHFKPEAGHLSVMTIGDKKGVSMRVDGQHRYKVGDLVMAVFEGAVVPEYLLRQGFWDEEKQIGMLPGGKKKNRVKATKFREQLSEFIMFPVSQTTQRYDEDLPTPALFIAPQMVIEKVSDDMRRVTTGADYIVNEASEWLLVRKDLDVAEFMGIMSNV